MKNKFKLLVIDNDNSIGDHGMHFADNYNLCFLTPHSLDELDIFIKSRKFDLVIITSALASMDYITVLEHIKTMYGLPVITVMDKTKESIDKIIAFEMGADNIITHPFEWRELVARTKALLRLVRYVEENLRARISQEETPDLAYFNGWMLDFENKTLCSATKKAPELTTAEFKLLRALCTTPKRAISREKLLKISHEGQKNVANDRSVDILIARLRKKLNDGNTQNALIKTVRGVGYILNADVHFSKSDATNKRSQMDLPH